jgi:transposase
MMHSYNSTLLSWNGLMLIGSRQLLANLLFGEGAAIEVESAETSASEIKVAARAAQKDAVCPACQVPSQRVHSRYCRLLHDVSLVSLPVVIRIVVRRFFCKNSACRRKVFSESLGTLAPRWKRSTERMLAAQREIALALGGEAGSRLATKLGMPISGDTLLRRLANMERQPPSRLKAIGVDDWALRRGQTYGTLICDLERKCPIAILPTRSAETLAAWLKEHPEIEVISRDRAGDYAKAASEGAPQATQVADRWHLLRNVQEALQKVIEPQQAAINKALNSIEPQASERDREISEAIAKPITSEAPESSPPSTAKDEARRARYEKVVNLASQGHSQRSITRITGLSRKTVSKLVSADDYQPRAQGSRRTRISRYADAIDALLHKGTANAKEIYRQLQERGFSGSYYMVRRYLRKVKPLQRTSVSKSQIRHELWSVRRTAWLLVTPTAELTPEDASRVDAVEIACPEVKAASELARGFASMVRNRERDLWDGWIATGHTLTAPSLCAVLPKTC